MLKKINFLCIVNWDGMEPRWCNSYLQNISKDIKNIEKNS
jgi:hypothetical protein